jgi:hypothetical protein
MARNHHVQRQPTAALAAAPQERLTHSSSWTIAGSTDYSARHGIQKERIRPMQLAPLRYTKIDGTAVAVSVKSATEAKAAVKELRHKKRELNFERKALVRCQRALRPKGGGKQGSKRGRKEKASTMTRAIDGLGGIIGGLFDHATASGGNSAREVAAIEREIRRIDDTLHNIDGCIVQLQGKLLTHR